VVIMPGPTSVELFTYRVGFGDCFLLRFSYRGSAKHVLIDFGSTAAPARIPSQMKEIALDIKERCAGKLDAIVATHRHADHISGFGGPAWKTIEGLKPDLALLPWTEDPDAAPDARKATRPSAAGLGKSSLQHLRALSSMHVIARAVVDEVRSKGDEQELQRVLGGGEERPALPAEEDQDEEESEWTPPERPFGKTLTRQLAFLGQENLANAQAVRNLMTLPREFLSFGAKTGLEKLLPGVKVHVLGPPTLEQSDEIAQQRATDPDEFWHVTARALERTTQSAAPPLFPGFKKLPAPKRPEVRWFTRRLDAVRGEELLELVRILDGAMNNTSLILLFEACGKKLLFPGDAQIENWSYALSKPQTRKLLQDVDVYKVGHHGSLNATPKSLWNLFSKRGPARRLKTFLSTRPGKHGDARRETEVPRAKLVRALQQETTLFSTTQLSRKDEFVHVEKIAP